MDHDVAPAADAAPSLWRALADGGSPTDLVRPGTSANGLNVAGYVSIIAALFLHGETFVLTLGEAIPFSTKSLSQVNLKITYV